MKYMEYSNHHKKKMPELCGSLLAANHVHLGRDMNAAKSEGISRFHIDVCDGHYTPYFAFSDQMVRDLRKETDSVIEVHFAVQNMPSITETFLNSGADIVTIQYESCQLPGRLISHIRSSGISPGISFIPATDFGKMEYFLDEVEYVNILGVDPGIGGQQFITKVLKKIELAADHICRNNLSTKISVDGGINLQNMKSIINAGAEILIFGSAVFSGNIKENINKIRERVIHG